MANGTVERIGGDMPPVTALEHWFLLRSRIADVIAELLPGTVGDGFAVEWACDYIELWGENPWLHFPDEQA